MKTHLLFVAVMLALVANDLEDRAKKLRPTLRQARERLWQKYDDVANLVLDELEVWNILRQEDYSTKKD
jgi:hypothetical protein